MEKGNKLNMTGGRKYRMLCACIVALLLMGACKNYQCPPFNDNGNPLIGDEFVKKQSDCVYSNEPEILNPNLADMNDLAAKIDIIERDAIAGRKFALKQLGHMIPTDAQLPILDRLGDIFTNYPNVTIDRNGYEAWPSYDGQPINHARQKPWNLRLGVNKNISGGTKGAKDSGGKWGFPSNEIPLLEKEGYDGGTFFAGPPQTDRIIEVPNDQILQGAPSEVEAYQGIYTYLGVKYTKKFEFSELGMKALEKLGHMEKQGMFEYANGSSQISPATDAIPMQYATTAHRLNEIKALGSTKLGDGKYIFLINVSGKDSMPLNQVYRIEEQDCDKLNLLREIPNKIILVVKWNPKTVPNQFTNQYNGRLELVPTNTDPTVGDLMCVNHAFLERYEIQNPPVSAKEGISGPIYYSKRPLKLSDHPLLLEPTPPGPNGLDINVLMFEHGDNSGPKVVLATQEANKGSPNKLYPERTSSDNVRFSVQAPNQNYVASNGKTIVGFNFLADIALDIVISRVGNAKLVVEDINIYIGPDMVATYLYWVDNYGEQVFWNSYRIAVNKCNVIFNLDGKSAYKYESGSKAKAHTRMLNARPSK